MTASPALIAVDWGTSAFRATLVAVDGLPLDRIATGDGILTAAARGFAATLADHTAGWRAATPGLPILMSGMIGSRQGWQEAPYLACPADATALATALVDVAAPGLGPVAIVPGLSTVDAQGVPDVMRGEETQILGALTLMPQAQVTFVLPGTHSKWVTVANGRIVGFATYMTGEVYAALCSHTILGALMSARTPRAAAFERGVQAAAHLQGGPGRLLNAIFSTRTLALFDAIAPEDGASYLSGLLIGAEIATAATANERIILIGSAELTSRYAEAARSLGLSAIIAPAECAAAGLLTLARASRRLS